MKNDLNLRAKKDARLEPPFTAHDFLEELLPLLKEYFVANFHTAEEENAVTVRFLNGQQFIITIH